MQSCKEKTSEIYLVLWLVRGVTTATKVHVLVGVEGGVAVRLAVQGLCETQYCAAVFIVNISIFFSKPPTPYPIQLCIQYILCVSFFSYIISTACFLFLFFNFTNIFQYFFGILFFYFLPVRLPWRRIACVVSSLGANAGRLVLVTALSTAFLSFTHCLSPSHSLCVDCINLAHVVIAAIDA